VIVSGITILSFSAGSPARRFQKYLIA